MDMIHGLKLAFTGEEIIRALDARIDACKASIQFRRDEIAGRIEYDPGSCAQVPQEDVEDEIRQLEHRVDVLTLFRERIFSPRIYLLGRKALATTGLLPPAPPPRAEPGLEKGIRWVTRWEARREQEERELESRGVVDEHYTR
jgi:hypothetical protein